jgi:hypothetical protein
VYPRVKEIGGRRYVYLVEGAREGGRVRQRTLCYLGSMSRLASGVPEETKRKIDARFQVDWRRVDERIAKIPLTFEELSEARRARYALSIKNGRQGSRRTQGDRQRAEGELVALSRIASARFREAFEEVGERSYRMR